nr:MIP-related peptides-like [Parasteatoda tepidariorum]
MPFVFSLIFFVSDYYVDASRESPASISDNTLRHILQLVSLGTGLRVPSPLSLRTREKSLKRARISVPQQRAQYTPRNQEFTIGSEFLGKRSYSEPEDKRMGSEFLGKRMGSEFLGKRMGSEFLGKRMGSEFLGKRMGSEFLGKRMGSEFLGKRMGSEFLGKRSYEDDDTMDDLPYKRMGSEFLGKRLDDISDEEQSQEDSIFHSNRSQSSEHQKRMGSEFLGRKRRDVEFERKWNSGA